MKLFQENIVELIFNHFKAINRSLLTTGNGSDEGKLVPEREYCYLYVS